jgi:hypothetical protein
MPTKKNKNGPSLYARFVEAYMRARPDEAKKVSLILLIYRKKTILNINLSRKNIAMHKLNGWTSNGMKNMLKKKLKNI